MHADRASSRSLDAEVGRLIRTVREAIGWSQRDLGRRVGRSQAWVSKAERARLSALTVGMVELVLGAMGARLELGLRAPFLSDRRRQREPVHSRMGAYVARRLRDDGWMVATEVEIGGPGGKGWIDVLAWHPETGLLLVIELKTEIHDLGAIQRSLAWYERAGLEAARGFGWRPRHVHGSLLLLATAENDRRALDNGAALGVAFPVRATILGETVRTGRRPSEAGRSVAMVDPRARRVDWVRPLRLDGRRTVARYEDYADFVRSSSRAAARRRRSAA